MAIMMAGPGGIALRAALAVPIVLIALPFVFIHPGGRDFDRWLIDKVFHLFIRPRERHWRRGPLPVREPQPVEEEVEEEAPKEKAPPMVREPVSALGILVDIFLIFSLAYLTGYFARGGGEELARWLDWVRRR